MGKFSNNIGSYIESKFSESANSFEIGKVISYNNVTGKIFSNGKVYYFPYTTLNDRIKEGDIVTFYINNKNSNIVSDISLYDNKSITDIINDINGFSKKIK